MLESLYPPKAGWLSLIKQWPADFSCKSLHGQGYKTKVQISKHWPVSPSASLLQQPLLTTHDKVSTCEITQILVKNLLHFSSVA
jgi:hypothetical protein